MTTLELSTKAREYREIQALIKELEAEAEALKQMMIQELDSRKVEELAAGEYKIRHSLYETSRLDSSKLKIDRPELYQAYIKKAMSTRFQVA